MWTPSRFRPRDWTDTAIDVKTAAGVILVAVIVNVVTKVVLAFTAGRRDYGAGFGAGVGRCYRDGAVGYFWRCAALRARLNPTDKRQAIRKAEIRALRRSKRL